jgi:hypothetical protein
MEDEQLTPEEKKAIRALQRLGERWPKSLLLFAGGTGISIRKPADCGGTGSDTEVAYVLGIRCDGGDGADSF